MSNLNRILFVEDEADIQAVAKIALENVGNFELEICSSGDEALAVAKDFLPELFLLDVMMPGKDGPSTLKALRKIAQLSDIPVIFMTAKVQKNEIEGLINLGALDVIAKPFDPMTLAAQINSIWLQSNL